MLSGLIVKRPEQIIPNCGMCDNNMLYLCQLAREPFSYFGLSVLTTIQQ